MDVVALHSPMFIVFIRKKFRLQRQHAQESAVRYNTWRRAGNRLGH
jgi:hypothetical protein